MPESESGATVPRRHGKAGCNRCKKTGSDITGPVYFLLREQAKSQVAIRDLQRQLKVIEDNQEDMVLAIHGIQNHLLSCNDEVKELPLTHSKHLYDIDENFTPVSHIYSLPNHQTHSSRAHQRTKNCIQLSKVEENVLLPSASKPKINFKSKEDGKGNMTVDTVIQDIDNKQDSGLESDCHNQVNDSGYNIRDKYIGECHEINEANLSNCKDELSLLLDIISQRGQHLQQEVTELKKRQIMINETAPVESRQEIKKLHESNTQLQHQLTAVEQEKDNLRVQLSHLETASQEMEDERKRLQERLEAAISEKQQLEGRIHGLHCQFVKAANTKPENCSSECLLNPVDSDNLQLRKNGKIILNNEQNRHKVSSILKENNVLELQRQLLTYTVENEVLQTKLEQTLHMYRSKAIEWEKSESLLKGHIKQLIQEKELLQKKLEASRVDFATIHANGKMLERALHAVSYDATDNRKPLKENLIQNGNFGKISSPVQHEHFNTILKDTHLQDFSDKTHSLPVIPLNQRENNNLMFCKRGHCGCSHALTGLLNGRIEIEADHEKQQLINFIDGPDAIRNKYHHKESSQLLPHHNEKCKDCYFTPISDNIIHSSPISGLTTDSKVDRHPSLIDTPIENKIWNGISSEQRPPSSINQELGIPSNTGVWDPPTLIDIQSPVKGTRYPYYKDQTDMDSIRSEFDPLSTVNTTGIESQHEIIDSLNLYTPLGQKQLSSTGDSLHSTSLEPGISAKFIPQVRNYSETKDIFSTGINRCQQSLLKRNIQLEKAWPISSSHPDVMKNMSSTCDMSDNQHYHSILGFMSTTEGETLL